MSMTANESGGDYDAPNDRSNGTNEYSYTATTRDGDPGSAAIPNHLSVVDGGRLRCDECGTTGIRPMHHAEECSHEHVPVREGDTNE